MNYLARTTIFSVCVTMIAAAPVFALTESQYDFFDKNGIYYYNPDGYADGCFAGLGGYDGVATAGLSDLNAAFVDTYHDIAAELGAEYGIPWEAVMAQGIIESDSGTSDFARERNNFFGVNARDDNPDLAYYYDSPQEGWRGYFEFISSYSRYREAGAFDYPNDPYNYIIALKRAGYATADNYVDAIAPVIKAVENRATEKGWALSSDGTSSSIGMYHGCSSVTSGNGDINATALALSWPDRSHALDDPVDAYRAALNEVGLSTYNDPFVQIGASCDAFVATVLRFSGADPNVACCGADNMLNYFASHPELYLEIENTGNSTDLQPGDIRAKSSHVEMYVIDEDGTGRIASASHGDRTADHSATFYPDAEYRIFRYVGGGN